MVSLYSRGLAWEQFIPKRSPVIFTSLPSEQRRGKARAAIEAFNSSEDLWRTRHIDGKSPKVPVWKGTRCCWEDSQKHHAVAFQTFRWHGTCLRHPDVRLSCCRAVGKASAVCLIRTQLALYFKSNSREMYKMKGACGREGWHWDTGFGAGCCAPYRCEAANNGKFTATAGSTPVALRPSALNFLRDSSEPSLPHSASCPRRLTQGTSGGSSFHSLNAVKAGGP